MRRVFVTGGGHGIGRSIVEAFVKEGDRVAFCDIDIARGREVTSATGGVFLHLMCATKMHWKMLCKHFSTNGATLILS